MNTLLEQVKSWWEGATTSTRIVAVGLVVIVIASLGVAGTLASSPNYVNLFTNLTSQDAAAITAKLDEEHQKYQIADNETTILVPAADRDHVRMDMVRAGLPATASSLLGPEWMDKITMGTTTDVQKQYIRLAEEGELGKTISSLDEVASAQVHVADSNDSPFLGDITPTSASVVVTLKPGEVLSGDEVMGIANLVAKSVKGLDVKNVVVSDGTGALLWDGGAADGPGGSSASKVAQEHQYAEVMRKQYQNYLDMVLGPSKSLVTVTAELNFDQIHTVETYNTKGTATTSAETTEQYTGGGSGAQVGGVAGATANAPGGATPTYPSTGADKSGGQYIKSETTTTFAPNTTQTDITPAQGAVKSLAVAVLVDTSIPPATVTAIQGYLSTLAQVSPTNPGRQVTVQQISFSKAVAIAQTAEANQIAAQMKQEMFAKIGAVVIVVGFLMFLFTRQTSTVRQHTQALAALESGEARPLLAANAQQHMFGYAQGEPEEQGLSIDDVLSEMPEVLPRRKSQPMLIPEIEEQQDVKLEMIREMIMSHPQSVSLLIKGWIAEDSGLGSGLN